MSETESAPTSSAKSMPAEVASSHQPYVPDSATIPELTWSAVALGSVLGIMFGASSLYLFLKVGMTVSASIPVAVLAITVFRWLSRAFGTRRRRSSRTTSCRRPDRPGNRSLSASARRCRP